MKRSTLPLVALGLVLVAAARTLAQVNIAANLGTVVVVEGAGPNAVAKIDFGAEGTKRLLLRYSPVTKL